MLLEQRSVMVELQGLQYSAPPVLTPRLIPLDELMSWAVDKKQGADSKLQLLKADQVTQSKSTDTHSRKMYLSGLVSSIC